jgi:predicted nucleic acid-binding protein
MRSFLMDTNHVSYFIQAEQKAKGKPIPPTDAQIAAVARTRRLIVLTNDAHFRFIDGLTVESWLRS